MTKNISEKTRVSVSVGAIAGLILLAAGALWNVTQTVGVMEASLATHHEDRDRRLVILEQKMDANSQALATLAAEVRMMGKGK